MRGNRVDLGLLVLFVLSLALATRIQADDGCVANQCVGVQPFVCSGAALVCKNYVGPDCGPCKGSLYTTSRCPNAGGQQNLWCADDITPANKFRTTALADFAPGGIE
jgi:hypothetical protein